MKKIIAFTAFLAGAACMTSGDAAARVNLDINIGQPAPIIVAPLPPPPPPPPPHRRIIIEHRPRFLYTPALGYSVSVDGPYDVINYGDRYYVYDDGRWFWAPAYDGPWVFIEDYRLPGRIRRYRFEEIRRFRDEEFHRHGPDGDWHDRGRWHDRGDWHDRGRWR